MKRKGIFGLFTSGIVLAGLLAAITIPAVAMVDTTIPAEGAVVVVDAPDSDLVDYKSDSEIRVFNEKQCVYVEDLNTYDGPYTGWVNSHLIHKFNEDVDTAIRLQGSVTFEREIVGVITSDADLDASDEDLGLDDVTYPYGVGFRGLELTDDSYSVDGNEITVNLNSSGAPDEIRVLTRAKIVVDIDIKPGSEKNPINNNGNGVIPVAILGSADFDANDIDVSTIELEGMVIKMTGKTGKPLAHIEDVNEDGYCDLMIQIQDEEGVLAGKDAATLSGSLEDGTPIEGTDSICLVPKKH